MCKFKRTKGSGDLWYKTDAPPTDITVFCDLGWVDLKNIHASLFVRKWYFWKKEINAINAMKKRQKNDIIKIVYPVQKPTCDD